MTKSTSNALLCNSCGKTDHMRKSSSKCIHYKKRIAKSKITTTKAIKKQIKDYNKHKILMTDLLDYHRKYYLKSSNSKIQGPIHEQPWVKPIVQEFLNKLNTYNQFYCDNCKESWPSNLNYCVHCTLDNKKFSHLNLMDPQFEKLPQKIKQDLESMTLLEELLISPVVAIMQVFRLTTGQYLHRGYIANFTQNLTELCLNLPRMSNDLPLIIINNTNNNVKHKELIVSKMKIERILTFLCNNNKEWIKAGIKIDSTSLNSLPENDIPNNLQQFNDDTFSTPTALTSHLNDNFDHTESEELNTTVNTFIESDIDIISEQDKIKIALNKASSNKINWPTIGKEPINEFKFGAILSFAFPKLFPYGYGDPTNKLRHYEVSEKEGFAHLLKYLVYDSNGKKYYPFAQHPRFKFYAYDRLRRHRALLQAKVYLNQNELDNNMTIDDLLDNLDNGNTLEMMKRMSAYAANISGSGPFWYNNLMNLMAAFEQYKCATFWWTKSYADHHWPDLHRLMPNGPTTDLKEKYLNTINNPHLVEWYFSHRLSWYLAIVFDKVYDVDWRWHRYEWQGRCTVHTHGTSRHNNDPDLTNLISLVYTGRLLEENKNEILITDDIKTAIEIGKESEQQVIDYVEKFLTETNIAFESGSTMLTSLKEHPSSLNCNNLEFITDDIDYSNLCNCVQRHTCVAQHGNIEGCLDKTNVCKKGFPKQLREKTTIIFTNTGNKVKADILLKTNDAYLNKHFRLDISAWRGNTDGSVILDRYAAINYMVKYVTKGETSSKNLYEIYRSVVESADRGDNPTSKLRSIMLRSIIGKRDIGQCEVSRYLLSGKLYESSFEFISQSLKLTVRLINLNKDGDKLTCKNLLDYFANRNNNPFLKDDLHKIFNLIDFLKLYKIYGHKLTKRNSKRRVVVVTYPHITYNKLDHKMYQTYCYYQLIKYSNWSIDNLPDLLDQNKSVQLWEQFIDNAPTHIHDSLKLCMELGTQLIDIKHKIDKKNVDIPLECIDIGSELVASDLCNNEFELKVNTLHDWTQSRYNYSSQELLLMSSWLDQIKENTLSTNQNFKLDISTLNKDQRYAYNIVNYLIKTPSLLPFKMIIIGQGGTGKSYLIRALDNLLFDKLTKSAPTGKAAHLINSSSIHNTYQVPVFTKKALYKYIELKGQSLKEFQTKFIGKSIDLFDEFSMISQSLWSYTDMRLRQAKCVNLPFGGNSVIAIGDPNQLDPIGEPIYDKTKNNELAINSRLVWNDFEIVVKLNINERAKNNENDVLQQKYLKILDNASMCNYSQEDWTFLMDISSENHKNFDYDLATFLFLDNHSVNEHNAKCLSSLNNPIVRINAVNSSLFAEKSKSDYFNQLENHVYMCIEAKVFLLHNIWIEKGLVNGAVGIIKDIIYPESYSQYCLPQCIIVHFHDYTGPQFFDNPNKLNWLPMTTRCQYSKELNCSRTQYSFRLNYACTIHKAQGSTIENVVLDLGSRDIALGNTYTGISRTRHIKNLIVKPCSYDRLTKSKLMSRYKERIIEIERLDKLSKLTMERFKFLYPE